VDTATTDIAAATADMVATAATVAMAAAPRPTFHTAGPGLAARPAEHKQNRAA
jgi:hypothetical protein